MDAITLSTIWNAFQSACREMRHVMDRTAQSYLIAQVHDVGAGVWDARARTIAVPEGPTSMFLSQKFSIQYLLDKFGSDLAPGDVILNNDPYHGHCNHLPDWGFFRPVFHEGELLFFTMTRGHQMDTGGSFPGGYFPNGFDIHAEGLMIPPIKIIVEGKERTDVLELIWNNVRFPEGVRIDNYSLIAATKVAETRILNLLKKYGRDTVLECVDEMIQRTEKAIRQQISQIPDGTYSGESATDDDGTVLDERVWVRCDATVKGDEMVLDFSRSDAQRPGFVNNVYSSTYSRAIAGSFLFFDPALAGFHNEGSMGPISVIAPPGSVVNAQYPATVGGSPVNVGTQVLEATVDALSKAVPEKAIASWGRRRGHYVFGTDPRNGQKYVQTTTDSDGGGGAVWGFDGYEGAVGFSTLSSIQRGNVEELEIRFPWRFHKYEFEPDRSGAGRWRGASGMHTEVENFGSPVNMATGSSDGDHTHPPGAAGGGDGPLCEAFIKRDGTVVPAPSHRMVRVLTGDVVVKISGGGGGVGDPFDRDPQAVLEDVRNQMVSVKVANEAYGVSIDPVKWAVDEAATAKLRKARRA